MRTRILEEAEYATKLAGTELGDVWQHYARGKFMAIVVENFDGQVIGCWGLMSVLHTEGLWVHPDHRNAGHVARLLLRKMAHLTSGHGVVTNSLDPKVTEYIHRLGGVEIPGQAYFWHMTKLERVSV